MLKPFHSRHNALDFLYGCQNKDYRKQLGLDARDLLYFTCRNATEDNSTSKISEGHLFAQTKGGNRKISTEDWALFTKTWSPDLIQQLSVDSSYKSSAKRQTRSVSISATWLKQLLQDSQISQNKVLGVIQGGMIENARKKSVEEVMKFPDLAGYVIAGFGYGEEKKDRDQILTIIFRRLPREKLKIMEQCDSPSEMLDYIEKGIDLFSTQLCDDSTQRFRALTFRLVAPFDTPFFEDLSDTSHLVDKTALHSDCPCFTCQNHSRAYLHHLVNTKEMLANILLQVHNYLHLSRFMSVARNHILADTFVEWKHQFQKVYPN